MNTLQVNISREKREKVQINSIWNKKGRQNYRWAESKKKREY